MVRVWRKLLFRSLPPPHHTFLLSSCPPHLPTQRKERLLHRSTYIFARNSQGQFYVQKRTMIKDYCPGYYEVVAGGVVGVSEGGREEGKEVKEGWGEGQMPSIGGRVVYV